jgi:WhiB family redox-sensing transcriptional regulator
MLMPYPCTGGPNPRCSLDISPGPARTRVGRSPSGYATDRANPIRTGRACVIDLDLDDDQAARASLVPTPGERRRDWLRVAACAGRSQWFFTHDGDNPAMRRYREQRARAICRRCPAMEECRRWARDHGEYGIWGAESEEDRAAAGFPTRRHRLRIDALESRLHTGAMQRPAPSSSTGGHRFRPESIGYAGRDRQGPLEREEP